MKSKGAGAAVCAGCSEQNRVNCHPEEVESFAQRRAPDEGPTHSDDRGDQISRQIRR